MARTVRGLPFPLIPTAAVVPAPAALAGMRTSSQFRGGLWDRRPVFDLKPRNAPKVADVVRCQDVTTPRGDSCNEHIVGPYPFTPAFQVRPDDARSFTRVLVQLHQLKHGAKLPAYDRAFLRFPATQGAEQCARAATRLRCQCQAARSSQTGSVFHGRLGGAFQFRQAPNQLRE